MSPTTQSIRSTHITRQNFGLLLNRVQQLIHDADFVALDTRLTGAHSATWRKSHVLDTSDISYHKLKHSAENFAIWQFGLCPFKWMEADKKYVAQPCNFYLFPRDELRVKHNSDIFLCEAEFLEVMAKHGFDFNMCIQNGLSHVSREQESTAAFQMQFQSEDNVVMHMIGNFKYGQMRKLWTSSADKLFVEEIRFKLMDWIETLKNNSSAPYRENDTKRNSDEENCTITNGYKWEGSGVNQDRTRLHQLITTPVIWYKSCKSLNLDRPSLTWESLAHNKLQVLLEVLSLDCKDLVVVVQPEASSSTLKHVEVFYPTSHEEKVLLIEELGQRVTKEKERKLAEVIGFRHVIDALVDSRKVVVGHHCILDFVHIHKSFFEPLPSTTAKFTAGLLENFSCIFDTKCIMRNIPHLETYTSDSLSTIYLNLHRNCSGGCCRMKVEISDELSINESSAQHKYSLGRSIQQEQVGYNAASGAYMAGCLFAYVCNSLNTDPRYLHGLPKPIKSDVNKELDRFKNLLCYNDATSSALDLSTGCEVADKLFEQKPCHVSNVALVWGYAYGSPAASIQLLIKESLNFNHPITVFPVDSSAALVSFECSEVTELFFTLIQRMPKGSYLGATSLSLGIRAANFAVYEFICKSSLSMIQLADCANHLRGFMDIKIMDTMELVDLDQLLDDMRLVVPL